MILSLLIVTAMAHSSQNPKQSSESLVLEVNRSSINLDFSKVKVDKVEEVTDCVYLAWRKGRISHRTAIRTLARLACVDNARVSGRPMSFHGDSWVSTGHWSKVIADVVFIFTKGTKDTSDSDRIKQIFIENGLAHKISNKFGERIEFEKKALSGKQKERLIQCVQRLEKLIEHDPRFDEKEPLDESHSPGDCEDSVSIKTNS